MLQTKKLEYTDGKITLEAVYAFDDINTDKRPVILIAHDWSGRTEFAEKKALKLAELGYVGFALDMYGKGQIGTNNDEKSALMKPLMADRGLLLNRMLAGLETAKKIDIADSHQMGAIGFCFGGLCALDLARSGAALSGVVSFHGLLSPPEQASHKKIQAKILALHGHDDPMGPPQQVSAFQNEMTTANVDWQMIIYGKTQHAFTNPLAKDTSLGLFYSASADTRSWIAMKDFFEEIFV